ncbi:putative TetR-family transcriptional regulator [Actinoplanes missouriensis 431]|uniref:Putative TetR-family transcriptional regulator n=1 Tax=Actinoplanes missouriensis (strain ATCC 14538 / DSM 43046 / CBS 188.64 / JCM 3121 / NBRC 102363 / NCIMB 12654 / NRRL B-3342 / UNCC 431) TaxID=512565 RepID=I0GYD4_ACTM4|nr:TetR/AcrR family transcriptional regulator [Actinoplanes missouriensis]BAL85771.1 putative TetR-family transcriptional regulator [Actinoplanes missouriensis 431]
MSAANLRARVRAEMTEEIKTVARRHLATDGANLSLRAVARDLQMASSAVYRYFASRDELLTALIIDAYNEVGDAAERAISAAATPLDKWLAACHAVRDWALANPHQWALIYGSPVPGYQAPQDTVGPATRVLLLLGVTLGEAYQNGLVEDREPLTGGFARELEPIASSFMPGMPPRVVADTIAAFFQLCGAVSAELFGQLNKSVDNDRRGFFEYQMRSAASLAGLA